MSTTRLAKWFLSLVCAGLAPAIVSAQQAVPTRDEIRVQYTWNLDSIYASTALWETDFAAAEQLVRQLASAKDAPIEDGARLLLLLTLREDARWQCDKLLVYAHQLSDQDTRDNAALAMKNRAAGLVVSFHQATAWIEPTLLTIPGETLCGWVQATQGLRIYAHYIDDVIRRKAHTLSPREEELLAMAGKVAASPEEAYNALKYAEMIWPSIKDEDGNDVALSAARYGKFIRSADRRVRRDAFHGTMEALGRFQNTFAATLAGAVERDNYIAKARGFETALESTMFPDNIPPAVYRNLVDTIHANLHVQHRWASLRKRTLGLDELHVYDLYQPLVDTGGREIPYDDAVQSIIAALEPLGPKYCEPMKKGFESRWIDVYETQGKRAGGYAWGSYDTHPFILINYNGTPREMSTIAHEMGHAMHSYFTHQHQPKIYGDYSGFVAEVAAIFNEILLEDYLLRTARTSEERLRLLNEQIDNLRSTVFRQVKFAEFEYEIHAMAARGEALTAESMGALYLDIFHKHWGPELVRDDDHAVYWAWVPHFYMNHYVYRYATAYCAAVALAEGVLAKRPGALDAYLEFLRSGSSDYPVEVLRKAGVDMTTPAPIEATMRRFDRLVGEMEKLLTN